MLARGGGQGRPHAPPTGLVVYWIHVHTALTLTFTIVVLQTLWYTRVYTPLQISKTHIERQTALLLTVAASKPRLVPVVCQRTQVHTWIKVDDRLS